MAKREEIPFERYPATRVLILFAVGILTAKFLSAGLLYISGAAGFVFAAYYAMNYLGHSRFSKRVIDGSIILYLILLIAFGFIRFGLYHFVTQNDKLEVELLKVSEWELVKLKGEVESAQVRAAGGYSIYIITSEIVFEDGVSIFRPLKIRATTSKDTTFLPGDIIELSGKILPWPRKRNPHEFDFSAWLLRTGVDAQVSVEEIEAHYYGNPKFSWRSIRRAALSNVDLLFSEDNAPIAKALMLGYKNELNAEDKQAFSRAGLSHIMAVSGLHVGFIIAPFWLIIPFFWLTKTGRVVGFLSLIAILFFYSGLTGFSPSVMRASLTAVFLGYGKLFWKVRDSVNLTSAAALVLLIVNPAQLFDVGFQLSFGAVYVILFVMPIVQKLFPYSFRNKWYGKLLFVIFLSIVVQLGLYPLQAWYFQEISLVSPLSNALFVPVLGFVIPFMSFITILSGVWLDGAQFLVQPVEFFLTRMSAYANQSENWVYSWFRVEKPDVLIFVLWVAIVGFVGSLAFPKARIRWFILLLTVVFGIQVSGIAAKFREPNAELIFFDVGQGDACLIRTPLNKYYLVDLGRWTPTYNSGKGVIVPHLKAKGITKIDGIFLTHPHSDHIGGILDVLEAVQVDTIYDSGFEYDSNLYKNYRKMAEVKNIPIKNVEAGMLIQTDPRMPIFIYGPQAGVKSKNPNEHSIVLELIHGDNQILLTGDAEHELEEILVKHFDHLLKTDLLKVGHHGSRTSSSSLFLEKTTPKWAVVSVASQNTFGHPHRETVEKLHSDSTQVLYTALEGAIIFRSNGKEIKRVFW